MKKKKVILLIVIIVCFILLISLIAIFYVFGNVKLLQDSVTVEAGEELSLNPTDFFELSDEKATDVIFDISQVDTRKVGEYEAVATYKKKDYIIKVVVEDTKAPQVTFGERYIFTNDIVNCDVSVLVKEVKDYSEYELTLVGFEKRGELTILTESELMGFVEDMSVEEEALSKLSTEIPKEEGIYRVAVKAEDSEGNFVLEEICLIYDTTAPVIADVQEKIIEQKDVTIEPEVDPEEYLVEDNVDGVIAGDNKTVSLHRKEEDSTTYAVEVVATDRAGNTGKKEFSIRVIEEKEVVVNNHEEAPQNSPIDVPTDVPAEEVVLNTVIRGTGPDGRSCYKVYTIDNSGYIDSRDLLETYLYAMGLMHEGGAKPSWIWETNGYFSTYMYDDDIVPIACHVSYTGGRGDVVWVSYQEELSGYSKPDVMVSCMRYVNLYGTETGRGVKDDATQTITFSLKEILEIMELMK